MQGDKSFVTPGCRLTLHYALTLADGTEVVSTFTEDPLTLTLGDGTMESALEEALIGLACDSDTQILLSGDDVFGPRNEEKIQQMSISDFPKDMGISAGQVIAFTTPGGDEVAGQVQEIEGDDVVIDFNHPLSGHAITFRVKVLQIEFLL
ncbi:MAG: FKBP-type peptidyl-prolyl cis-trans isomerase [Gammaproteobacteria bacterium]|nr:FKBP-type peptidyl-prolyl cis-trans isomerase [Gammaproteobacteria bacterium]